MDFEIVATLGVCLFALYWLIHRLLLPTLGSKRAWELVKRRSFITLVTCLPTLFRYFVLQRRDMQHDEGDDQDVEAEETQQPNATGSSPVHRDCMLIWLFLAADFFVVYPLIGYYFVPGYVLSTSTLQFWLLFAPYVSAALFRSALSALVAEILVQDGGAGIEGDKIGSERLRLRVMQMLPSELRLALYLSQGLELATALRFHSMLLADVHTSGLIRICAIHDTFAHLYTIADKLHAVFKSSCTPYLPPLPSFLQWPIDAFNHHQYYRIREGAHRFGHVLSAQSTLILLTHLGWRVLQSATWPLIMAVQWLLLHESEAGTTSAGDANAIATLAYFNAALIGQFVLFVCSLIYWLRQGLDECCFTYARDSILHRRIEFKWSRPPSGGELRAYNSRVCCVCDEAMWFGTVLFHAHCHHICHLRCVVEATKGDNDAAIKCPHCQVVLVQPDAVPPQPDQPEQQGEVDDSVHGSSRGGGLRRRLKDAWKSVTGSRRRTTATSNEIWL